MFFINKMVSILINIIQHEQYLFSFQAHVSAACSFLACSKSHHIMPSFMSHHWVNNKCNWVKRQCWQIYALCNFLLYILRVFRSNHNCSWKFHKFHWKTPVLESLFFLTMIKLYNNISSAWISCITANFFSHRLMS